MTTICDGWRRFFVSLACWSESNFQSCIIIEARTTILQRKKNFALFYTAGTFEVFAKTLNSRFSHSPILKLTATYYELRGSGLDPLDSWQFDVFIRCIFYAKIHRIWPHEYNALYQICCIFYAHLNSPPIK